MGTDTTLFLGMEWRGGEWLGRGAGGKERESLRKEGCGEVVGLRAEEREDEEERMAEEAMEVEVRFSGERFHFMGFVCKEKKGLEDSESAL